MAFSTATRTFNIKDYVATRYDVRRTKVYVTTNVENDRIFDTVSGDMRLGTGAVTIAPNGDVSITVPIPGTTNPASWQTTVHIDYPDAGTRERHHETIGPFTITSSGLLADLVVQQEIPPTYLSVVTAQLDGYVDDAEFAANQAETARDQARDYRDEARDISNISTPDGLVKALIDDPGSLTGIELNTGFVSGGVETSGRRVSAHPDGLLGAMDGLAAWLTDPFGTGTVTLVGDSTMHDPGLAFDSKRAYYQFAQMVSAQYPGIYMRYFRHDGALGGTMFFRPPIDVSTPVGVSPVYWETPGTSNYQPWVLIPRSRQGKDLDLTGKVEPTAWTGATQHTFFMNDENAVSDKEIAQATIQSDGTMRLRWWDTPGHVAGTATGAVPITPPASGPLFVRWTLDTDLADTGAGTGWAVKFMTSTDNFTWTTLETITNASATTIRKAATARLYFGWGGGGSSNFVGKLYEVWARAFIDGPLIPGVPYCVSAWRSTTVPIYKSQVKGGPQLDFFNGSWPGKSIADTFDNPDYFPWLMVPGNNLLHLLNTNTNDSGLRGVLLRQQWASLLAHHRAVVPGARIVSINGVPSILSSDTMPEKPVRAAQMAAWLPTQGVPVIDTWRAWLEDGRAWSTLNTGEHHPIDDGTLSDTNPVRRQARVIFNSLMASSFATQNPATGSTALVRS